ncbi:MAG: nucleotidyltransferase [Psychrilyobacter sp.]|nr:nucleotidyltransferase [Psychrilyobacter sp.]
MKAVGIIVEYNPFHNGHKLHLEKAKESGDLVIAIMSGNFLQRGEPGIYDKWIRAEMAIENGVDIVVELPVFFSTQSAEGFAFGGVDILDKLGVEELIFGSESSNVEMLEEIAKLQLEKKEILDEKIKKEMDSGISYPNAMNNVLKEVLGVRVPLKPNDVLGLEYIKNIKKLNSKILPKVIGRKSVGYYEKQQVEEFASATAIRAMIKEKNIESIKEVVPVESFDLLGIPTYLEEFYPLIRYEILNNTKELKNISDMEGGLENRIYKMAYKYNDFKTFYENLMTRRYTNGRMQRVLIHILLKIDKNLINSLKCGISYTKVLGFSSVGARYLKENKENLKIKILSGLKNVTTNLNIEEKKLLDFEIKCDRIYSIINNYEERSFPIIKGGN